MAAPPPRPASCEQAPAATAVAVVSGICIFLPTVATALRLYARLFKAKQPGWDDVTLVIGYAILMVNFAFIYKSLALGIGRPEGCTPPDAYILGFEYGYLSDFCEATSNVFSRVSAAILILRIFGVSRNLKWALISYTVFQAVVCFATGAMIFAQCTPVQGLWNPNIHSTCWPPVARNSLVYLDGAVSVVADVIVAVVPAYYMRKSFAPKRVRALVTFLFSLSLVPCASALARTILSNQFSKTESFNGHFILEIVALLETALLVVCASIPALPIMFRQQRKGSEPTSRERVRLARTTSSPSNDSGKEPITRTDDLYHTTLASLESAGTAGDFKH